jgi:hypothetical protein
MGGDGAMVTIDRFETVGTHELNCSVEVSDRIERKRRQNRERQRAWRKYLPP